MTIHEVENITGLPRANVRFYESEGLIAPQRAKNGYRDYSEEDIEKLNKIKLLRALDFSIEDIRSLDNDSADFTGLLKQRVDLISSDKSRLTRSQEVLEKMLSDGVDYASLNCGIYLEELQKPSLEISAPAPIVPQEDSIIKPGVWRRYFARSFDHGIYSLIIYAVFVCVFKINTNTIRWFDYIEVFLVGILILIFEPVFLCLFGTTPGKWLLGIKVTGLNGRKLSYRYALSRTFELLFYGYGLMIPIISLIRQYKCYKAVKSGDEPEWEWYTELRLTEKSSKQVISYISAEILWAVIMACIILSPRIAPNRGRLTVSEFAENYNHYQKFFFTDFYNLDEKGHWTYKYSTEPYSINPNINLPNINLIVDIINNGTEINRVMISNKRTSDTSIYMTYDMYRMQALSLAFIEAQEGINIFTNDINHIKSLIGDWTHDYSFTLHGVSVNYTVEYTGEVSKYALTSENGEPVYINYRLIMDLIEE